MPPTIKYYVGSIHNTNKYGKVKVLKRSETKRDWLKIKFLNSGHKLWCGSYQITLGTVTDPSVKYPQPGEVYPSKNYGDFEIIEYGGKLDIKIRFIETGYETTIDCAALHTGSVKDRLASTKYGYFIGDGKYSSAKNKIEYRLFAGMWDRVTNNDSYKKAKIAKRWRNFQNFCDDIHKVPYWDEIGFHMDKDLKIIGNNLYSKDTVIFIPGELNQAIDYREVKGYSKYRNRYEVSATRKYLELYGIPRTYATKKEAIEAYWIYKNKRIKGLAKKYKKYLPKEAFYNLMNFESLVKSYRKKIK